MLDQHLASLTQAPPEITKLQRAFISHHTKTSTFVQPPLFFKLPAENFKEPTVQIESQSWIQLTACHGGAAAAARIGREPCRSTKS